MLYHFIQAISGGYGSQTKFGPDQNCGRLFIILSSGFLILILINNLCVLGCLFFRSTTNISLEIFLSISSSRPRRESLDVILRHVLFIYFFKKNPAISLSVVHITSPLAQLLNL